MMKCRTILIWLSAPALAASCAPVESEGCAGWRPLSVSEQTLGYLAENDPQALAEMIAHQEFGKAQGCWK